MGWAHPWCICRRGGVVRVWLGGGGGGRRGGVGELFPISFIVDGSFWPGETFIYY